MIYGLYLSAAGVMTNSYRQDVISNNIANAETVGFKRDLALFQERRTERAEHGLPPGRSNALLEALGGGVLASPTLVDKSQGELEPSESPLDMAIVGQGYFTVSNGDGQTALTRNGRFLINSKGHIALASNEHHELLDVKGKPITIEPRVKPEVSEDGQISQDSKPVARIAIVDVPDPSQLTKTGATMLSYPDAKALRPATQATLKPQYVERANVEPSTELASLMDAQRQLEANANMIRYQDQMLQRLCNEVGKIS
jgi:flagellar basal-body rod protein FlgG